MEEEVSLTYKALLFAAVWILPALLVILFQVMPGWSEGLFRFFSIGY